ncbi:hypothetical protein OCT63_20550 [Vibrio sp. RW]|nr:hypothetical protein [Vibrio sp. RW]MDA0146615.1 hypothetical protein [Vibrio sp. RW]
MPAFKKGYQPTKEDIDNRSRQLNQEHDAYWASRGDNPPKQSKKGKK